MTDTTTTHTTARFLSITTAAALALGGLVLVGCDTDEMDGTMGGDDEYAAPDGADATTESGGIGGAVSNAVSTTVAEVRAEVDKIVGGEGTAQEKLGRLLESGQERFDALGEEFDDAEGGESTASFFGTLNERFDTLQEQVSEGNYAAAASSFGEVKNLQIPEMAKPYVQPYMDGISNLMSNVTGGEMGAQVGNALGGMMGGGNNSAADAGA